MVNLFKKAEEETFANGRVIITNFKKLKKENFPQYEDMLFLNYDGKIYIDMTDEANEAIVMVLRLLVQYSVAELRKWEREQKRRFPNIKDFPDLKELKGEYGDFMNALGMLLIPLELESRQRQKAYYGII